MKKNSRFMIGLAAVGVVVLYLMWTGVSQSMIYVLTPTELLARVAEDPSFREVGVKVPAQLVPDTYRPAEARRLHHFRVRDSEDPAVTFDVEYDGILPDTFVPAEEMEVVVEGRFRDDGVFVATTVLTKCGSRYEASDEALAG